MAILNSLVALATDANINLGLVAIGAGIAILTAGLSSIGEGWIACHAIDAMSRNPEQAPKFQSVMILAIALDESCGIYALIVSMLIMFVLGGRA